MKRQHPFKRINRGGIGVGIATCLLIGGSTLISTQSSRGQNLENSSCGPVITTILNSMPCGGTWPSCQGASWITNEINQSYCGNNGPIANKCVLANGQNGTSKLNATEEYLSGPCTNDGNGHCINGAPTTEMTNPVSNQFDCEMIN